MDQIISANQTTWKALEERLGYRFRERSLLCEAMTHSSFANEFSDGPLPDNERLEFLGDAVLDLVVGHRVIVDFPDQQEGELTRMRAEVVAEGSLAALSRKLGLGECLLLGRGEERSGGRDKSSLLADALEALFGALYLDSDYSVAASVIEPLFIPLLQQTATRAGGDFKTQLQEYLQGRHQPLPKYRLVEDAGPAHRKVYTIEVEIDGKICGVGQGHTKKKAEQSAAQAACKALKV